MYKLKYPIARMCFKVYICFVVSATPGMLSRVPHYAGVSKEHHQARPESIIIIIGCGFFPYDKISTVVYTNPTRPMTTNAQSTLANHFLLRRSPSSMPSSSIQQLL